jgi:hypothetical protein
VILCLLGCVGGWTGETLHAQGAPPSVDAPLLARADSITVGDYCVAARQVLASADVRAALVDELTAAEQERDLICDPRVAGTTFRQLLGDQPATLAGIARLSAHDATTIAASVIAAMEEFYRVTRSDRLRPVIRAALGDSLNGRFVRAAETEKSLLRREVRDASLVRLGRYERKLGPTSARLNGLEVLLNYAAQRWVPGFSATTAQGPSPWEVVASYVSTYGTMVDGKAQAVSATEFGVRHYLFGKTFAASGWRGVLFPSHWSVGALVVSDRNGALVWPWSGASRTGAYASWGSIKVGYVSGRRGAVLMTRQLQVIPFLF